MIGKFIYNNIDVVSSEMPNQTLRDTLEVDFLKGSSFQLKEPALSRDDFNYRYRAIQQKYANGEMVELDFGEDAILTRDIEAYLTKAVHFYWIRLKLREKQDLLSHDIDPLSILSELFILWHKREVEQNGYDPMRGKFKLRVFFSTYIGSKTGLVAGAVTQMRRNANKQTKAENAALDNFENDDRALEEDVEKSEFYREVIKCLDDMADRDEIEKLYFIFRLGGFSVKESIKLLGLDNVEEERLHNLFSRMRKKLAEYLIRRGYPDDVFLSKTRPAAVSKISPLDWHE